MHVWTLLQYTMIVVYVLRRTTVQKGYITPVLLSSFLFVNKVLTLITCDNGSEKGTSFISDSRYFSSFSYSGGKSFPLKFLPFFWPPAFFLCILWLFSNKRFMKLPLITTCVLFADSTSKQHKLSNIAL